MPAPESPQTRLLQALQDPARYPHPVGAIDMIETHISVVVLAGKYAYKIKKPLNLGFLDFSTLELRRHYCEEELRLNRRLAPGIYIDVVAFTGSPDTPRFDGDSSPFEYAVKMRRFEQDQLLDRLLDRGELDGRIIEALARDLADFHTHADVAPLDSAYGRPETALAPMIENFEQLRPLVDDPDGRRQLENLESWTRARHAELADCIAARKRDGFVRECHGDMHLGNMALVDGEVTIFDCIEFNDTLRWIDVISELAFLTMDLDYRGAPALSRTVLNDYLEVSGDYAGLRLLRFYQVYRAMVRAKVTSIRAAQEGLSADERTEALRAFREHVDLAERYTTLHTPAVMITHGVSGSGKTTIARSLVEDLGAIQLRSDIERKRLFGLQALDRSASALGTGIYTTEATARTYARLLELSEQLCRAGFPVVVDATFLERDQRAAFAALASRLDVPFLVLDCTAEPQVLQTRVRDRRVSGRDASEADLEVLARQLREDEPLGPDEPGLTVNTDAPLPLARIRELFHRPGDR